MSTGRFLVSMTLLICLGLAPSAQAQSGPTSIFLNLEEHVSGLIEEALGAWGQLFNLPEPQKELEAQPLVDLSSSPTDEASTAAAAESAGEAESTNGPPPASEIQGTVDPWG